MPTRAEQEALRKAFMAGSYWRATGGEGGSKPEAIRRYPIQEPRVVKISMGLGLRAQEYRVVNGAMEWRYEGDDCWRRHGVLTHAQLKELLQLFESPMEDV